MISFNSTIDNQTQITVESKIGISFISAEKACEFKDWEIPSTNPFDSLVGSVKEAWDKEVLNTITTTEVRIPPLHGYGIGADQI